MKTHDELVIKICGSAGDGSISATEILNRAASLMGYHIMNFDSYPAEIRGFGKSCGHTRICRDAVLTPGSKADCLVSLNDQHAITELEHLSRNCVIIYDSKPPDYLEEDQAIAGFIEPGMIGYGVPLRELSTMAVKSSRSRNIVALGIISGIFNMAPGCFEQALLMRFARKPKELKEVNLEAFRLGYQFAREKLVKADPIDFANQQLQTDSSRIIISGNAAAARACLDAKITLYAGYPITPATKIMEILAKELPRQGGSVIQTEDEISAIGHITGAGFAGKRAVTATSGPGMCLMTEMLNLAVMAEIPLVLINSQRGGPSTGLPTKTEQSDLNLAVLGASGDSPRPVLAPGTVEECYTVIRAAFDIAEQFQTPVIVLLDFFLSNRLEDAAVTSAPVDWLNAITTPEPETPYLRFKITPNGISPRTVPGMKNGLHTITGLEHDERGRPNYEMDNHRKMTEKRYAKMTLLKSCWKTPIPTAQGPVDAGLIAWGSTRGAAMEALAMLKARNINAAGWFPVLLNPLNTDSLTTFSNQCQRLYVAEMNHTGQFAAMVEAAVKRDVHRITGLYAKPMPPEDIASAIWGGPLDEK